jgi:hypothetical protein
MARFARLELSKGKLFFTTTSKESLLQMSDDNTATTISLGDQVRDNISGYEGIATIRMEWLSGRLCFQVNATDLKPGGSVKRAQVFDVEQLTVTRSAVIQASSTNTRLGANASRQLQPH